MSTDGVARTADDAARGKLAAVELGYYSDPFAEYFAPPGGHALGALINRGQYARVAAISSACEQFLHATAGQAAQIVSLGAGFDTCFDHSVRSGREFGDHGSRSHFEFGSTCSIHLSSTTCHSLRVIMFVCCGSSK